VHLKREHLALLMVEAECCSVLDFGLSRGVQVRFLVVDWEDEVVVKVLADLDSAPASGSVDEVVASDPSVSEQEQLARREERLLPLNTRE